MKRFEDSVEKVEKENKRLRIELDRVQKELKQTAVAAKGAGTAMGGMGKMAGTVKTALAASFISLEARPLSCFSLSLLRLAVGLRPPFSLRGGTS